MTNGDLETIKTWFVSYAERCMQSDGDCAALREQLEPRLKHSLLVAEECRALADDLIWPGGMALIGQAIGILHDAGRFSQFAVFGTFVDSYSVDHCRHGHDIVKESGILGSLPGTERRIILDGIRYHNLKWKSQALPESIPFIQLVHDADRLDRFRITLELIKEATKERNLSLMLDGPVSQPILSKISRKKTASRKAIAFTLDFFLFRLSSVFTIHYPQTFRRLRTSGLFEEIADRLPDEGVINGAVKDMRKFLDSGS